jgi:hypothetical protein
VNLLDRKRQKEEENYIKRKCYGRRTYLKGNAMVGERTLEEKRNECEILIVILEGMRLFGRLGMDKITILRLFLRNRTWECAPDRIDLIDSNV